MKDKLENILDNLNNSENSLEDLSNVLSEMRDIALRVRESGSSYQTLEVHKSVEDGILDKIYDANQYQLNYILTQYYFRYYTEYNKDRELLRKVVQKNLRDKKLEDLGL